MIEPDTHAENPATKRRFRNLLDVSGLLAQLVELVPRPATDEEILRCPRRARTSRASRRCRRDNGGDAGELHAVRPRRLRDRAALGRRRDRRLDAVLDGEVDNVYALVRPPGHHAEPGRGDGASASSRTSRDRGAHARAARGARARRGRRLGRPPRQRHPDDVLRRSERPHDLAAPGRLLPARSGAGRATSARARATVSTSTSRCRAGSAAAPTSRLRARRRARARAFRAGLHHRRVGARRRAAWIRSAAWMHSRRLPRADASC